MTFQLTNRTAKGLTAAFAIAALFGPAATIASAASTAGNSAGSMAGPAQPGRPAAQTAPNACNDSAYSLIGGKWQTTLNWRFQASTSPEEYTTSSVLNVIKRSFNNMTGARNDCGLPDTVSATSSYLGSTSSAPNVTKRGYCSQRDGNNVIGFGGTLTGRPLCPRKR